jgi:hypothetical protein
MQRVEGVFAFDSDIYRTPSDRAQFAYQFLTGEAATAWRVYCERNPLLKHTWKAMRALLQDRVTPPQQRSACAFGQLRNVKHGPDQLVTSFVAYIIDLAHKTDISDATKRMFLLTRLHPEVRSMMPRGIAFEAFDTMVDTVIRAENNLQFEAESVRTWLKGENVADKTATKYEQQQQLQRNHLPAGRNP